MILMVSDSESLLLYCVILHESVFLCGRALLFSVRPGEVRGVGAGEPGASSSAALLFPTKLAPDVV